MLKNFKDLSQIDVKTTPKPMFKFNEAKRKMEKAGEIDTISWVDCLKALYENGAEKVIYENVQNENGGLLFEDENKCLHIKVFVEIDGDRREIFYPVIDGTKDVSADKITQSDIYNAKQRAFVKCVAVNWGLGLKVWEKDDAEEKIEKPKDDFSVYSTFRELVNTSAKKFGGVAEMLAKLDNVKEKEIRELLVSATKIDAISKELRKILGGEHD